jgi:hypothetical protein
MPVTFYKLILWRYYSPLITLIFLLLNGVCGHIFMPDSSTTPEQYRDLGAALAFPLISGFCFLFLPILGRKAQASILESARLSGSSMRHAVVYAQHVSRVPRLSFRLAAIAGSTIAISYMALEGLFYASDIDLFANLKRLPLHIEAIYFFVAVILLIISLVRITALLTRFATRDLRIELFHIEELVPLADTVLWNTISISAALALSPIFWLGRTIPPLDISLVLAVLAATLYLLFSPIFQVRRIVSQRKRLALERIRGALKSATQSDEVLKRRLTDSPKRLEEINNLVGVREEITRTKEWPITMPVGIRVVLVVLIPPISWISASIVDWVVLQIVS